MDDITAAPQPVAAGLETIDAKKYRDAIEAAVELRRKHTEQTNELIKGYTGRAYRGWGNENLDNHAFKWVTTVVPQMVFTNPRVRVTNMGIADQTSAFLQQGLNCLLPQIEYAQQLTRIAYDLQFDFGVGLSRLETTPGLRVQSEIPPLRPTMLRVSPRMYFRDPDTPMFNGVPRYEGHLWIGSKKKLAQATLFDGSPMYRTDALSDLNGELMPDDIRRDLAIDGLTLRQNDEDMLVCYSLFDREQRKLISLAFKGNSAVIIRDPTDYVGAQDSPYELFGLYLVPDQVYPLAPLVVTKAQADEIARHRKQASEDADAAKRLTLVNSNIPGLIGNVRNANSGDVLGVPGFNGLASTMDLGGANPAQLEYINFASSKLEELSGVSDFMRGDVTGKGTATEVAEAAQWADLRVKTIQNQFKWHVSRTLKRFCDLMEESDQIAFPCTLDDPATGQKMPATFYGGQMDQVFWPSPWKRSSQVEIEPYSMEYVNQVVLRAQLTEAFDRILAYTQAAMSMPALRVMNMVNDLFQSMNIPEAAAKYIDPNVLGANIMAIQMSNAARAANGEAAAPAA